MINLDTEKIFQDKKLLKELEPTCTFWPMKKRWCCQPS